MIPSCKKCKFVRTAGPWYSTHYVCWAVRELQNDAFHGPREVTYTWCNDKNGENDCKDFQYNYLWWLGL